VTRRRRARVAAPLPTAFAARMGELLGDDEAAALLDALARPPARGVRVQPGRTTLGELSVRTGWPLRPLPWTDGAAVLEAADVAPGRHPLHEAGAFYVQDPSAMAPGVALGVRPGAWAIDLAAAPGGKATALAGDLAGRGVLVANDVGGSRLAALARNLERVGARNAVVTGAPPAELARRWPGRFDAVLLDAPCSGEGMFRKSEAARRAWSRRAVAACAIRQDDLLDAAAELLAPGGHLVYATCTFAPEENEGAVARLLARRDELRPAPVRLPGTDPGRPDWAPEADALPAEACARLWPHRHPGDGHFLASLVREGEPAGSASRRRDDGAATGEAAGPAVLAAWRRFAGAALMDGALPEARREGALREASGVLWAAPPAPDARGLTVLRPGLALGRAHGDGRFEPAHALAQALRPHEARARLDLHPDGPSALRFLAGEELGVGADAPPDVRSDGLEAQAAEVAVLVCVAGVPVGWGQRRGTRLRNRYPKGLRRRR
jgi:16S rRNA C967 or C1407 C5-methylase (RsmB/RsmF family)/NOL1/NOP2/fmu family ribosome biogenesis protein